MNTEKLVPRVRNRLASLKRLAFEPKLLSLALRGYDTSLYLGLRMDGSRSFGLVPSRHRGEYGSIRGPSAGCASECGISRFRASP